ncbi:MAG: hypothetical protein J0L47_11205 [Flavobacteriales bacterium]|jgi:hypothetical protein|nr:hypothetical protein [Flavobacteriales bacterium]MCA0392354.1 hypothetical protein [Bacteroidota bacterium]
MTHSFALEEADVQKFIKNITEKLGEERVKHVLEEDKEGKLSQYNDPKSLVFMSARKITDEDGSEKLLFVMNGAGSLTMVKKENGLYELAQLDDDNRNIIWKIFQTSVEFFADKKLADIH